MEQAAYLGNGGEEAARLGGLVVAPCQRARVRYRCGPRVWPGRPGSSWRREVVGARGGVGTADAGEVVATIGVGRGGGGVLGVPGRVAWA